MQHTRHLTIAAATAALLGAAVALPSASAKIPDSGATTTPVSGSTTSTGKGADLRVTVRPKGEDGPTRTRRIRCGRLGEGSRLCRRLAGLKPTSFAPVPPDVACIQIYGGPPTARVRGELRGTQVDARFNRANGCEIERWDPNRAVLGAAREGTPATVAQKERR